MRLPNKTTEYEKSVIAYFPEILKLLSKNRYTVLELYAKIQRSNKNINDFLDALVCLYALGKVDISKEGELHYVG